MRKKTDEVKTVPQRDKLKKELSIGEFNWSEKQKQFIDIALNKDTKVMFVSGPAGSSKTLMSVFACLKLLSSKKISDILYVRSAVETGKKIGFLPGDIKDKLGPYNVPFYDKLSELLSKSDVDSLINDSRVHCLAVNYARGLSLNVKGLIYDECIAGDEKIVTDKGVIKLSKLFNEVNLNKNTFNIKTFNESTKTFEYKPLKRIWSNGLKEVINVKAGNRKIRCTDNHKFLTSTGWKEAKYLKKGDILIANNVDKHQILKCVCDGIEYDKEIVEVFDLEVEDNHNFIISSGNNESGIVAHNCQNSSLSEIFTILTRFGPYCKGFFLADPEQSDLPKNQQGDFEKIFKLFDNEESRQAGIHVFKFDETDIVRSDLVKFIITKKKELEK